MPSTTVNTMPRSSQVHTTVLDTPPIPATDTISLREFVVDEDAENFNAALWRTIDQNAFILAQRDALEAFNVAKALRLSKETAAAELERRQAAPTPQSLPPQSIAPSLRHQHHGSQPIAIKKVDATHSQYSTDEAIARSLARSSQIEASFHENRSSPSSSTSLSKSVKISPSSSSYHQQDKKAPASIAKQNSRNQLSLSTSSFPNSSPPSTAIDSRHSRSTSQSNTFTKVPSLLLPSISHAGDQRSLSKREPVPAEEATGAIPSASQFQTPDVIHTKRRRTERRLSVSPPSLDVVVTAPPISAPQKSSTFSKNLRPGTIIPPTCDTASSPMSPSEVSKSNPPPPPTPKQTPVPKQKAHLHNPFNDSQICPQCGNRLTVPRIQVNSSSSSFHLALSLISFIFYFSCSFSFRSFRFDSFRGFWFSTLLCVAAFYSS